MANVNELKTNIVTSYKYLKDRLKDSLKGEVPEDYQYFPLSEEILDVRLDDLRVEFASIFDNSTVDYKYNGLENIVIINKKYIARGDINPNNLYMDIALNVAYYNPKLQFSGFGNETYEALNKGFREMVTLAIVGEDRSREYFESDEYVYANLLNKMIDVSTFWKAFFGNNPKVINEVLRGKTIEYSEIFADVNTEANRNYKVRNTKKGISTLDKVELGLVNMYMLSNPTEQQLGDFLCDMVSEPKVFKDSQKYGRLSKLDLVGIFNDYIQNLNTEKTY